MFLQVSNTVLYWTFMMIHVYEFPAIGFFFKDKGQGDKILLYRYIPIKDSVQSPVSKSHSIIKHYSEQREVFAHLLYKHTVSIHNTNIYQMLPAWGEAKWATNSSSVELFHCLITSEGTQAICSLLYRGKKLCTWKTPSLQLRSGVIEAFKKREPPEASHHSYCTQWGLSFHVMISATSIIPHVICIKAHTTNVSFPPDS